MDGGGAEREEEAAIISYLRIFSCPGSSDVNHACHTPSNAIRNTQRSAGGSGLCRIENNKKKSRWWEVEIQREKDFNDEKETWSKF